MTTAQIVCWVAAAILAPGLLGIIVGKATNPTTGPHLMMHFGPDKGLDRWRHENYRNDGRFAGLLLLLIPAVIYMIYKQF